MQGDVRLRGGRAVVTCSEEARPLGGQPGARALLLRQLRLRLREREEHAALDLSGLDAWAARGAAGGPGLWDEPAEHRGGERPLCRGHKRRSDVHSMKKNDNDNSSMQRDVDPCGRLHFQ